MTPRTVVVSLTAAAGFVVLFANDNLLSPQPFSLIAQANARVGRPLTPVSVAGVARRTHRRAYYGAGSYYGVGSYYGTGAYLGYRGYDAYASGIYGARGSYYPGYGAYATGIYGGSSDGNYPGSRAY
jgi:hypothetical protein